MFFLDKQRDIWYTLITVKEIRVSLELEESNMGKYMYDCYDKDEKPLGIFFEDGTKELLEHYPNVKYVRGMDAVTRLPIWHEVRENGLFSYKPKKKNHYDEQNWSYSDFI